MPKISVIVPVYNVEEYLEWCLSSLAQQTLKEIEIVCVNDGSTDSSRNILSSCQTLDPRIKIIDKENGGLSSARNEGIRAALADIVCFLDSDDRLVPEACERIVEVFESTQADVVTFGANCYPESSGYPWLETRLSPRDAEYISFHPDLLFAENSTPFAWRTACRKEFLITNALFFDETLSFGEDQVFQFAVYPKSSKTVLVSDKLYDYRVVRAGSLMSTINNDPEEKARRHIAIVGRVFADWKNQFRGACYTTEIVRWSISFVLYEILCLSNPERKCLLARYYHLFESLQTCSNFDSLTLSRAEQNMLEALFDPDSLSNLRAVKLRLRYFVHTYGVKGLVGKILGLN